MSKKHTVSCLVIAALAAGCNDWDNPVALSELQPEVELEIEAAHIETFEEIEIAVHIEESGLPMEMEHARLQITSPTGAVRSIALQPGQHGHEAHVTFYEPGEHHVHVMGTPRRHRLETELGEFELEVERKHEMVGPYRVEIAVSPAPISKGVAAHVHLYAFEELPDGSKVEPVSGLEMAAEFHDPFGIETHMHLQEEEAGEYETEFEFAQAGMYELHVEIEEAVGEFHLAVLDPDTDLVDDGDDGDTGGGGHAH